MSETLPVPDELAAPQGGGRPDVLVVAGEHSGDEHAARLVAAFRERQPAARVCALGGPKLAAAGAQLLYDLTESSVVGLVEVLRHYGHFKRLFEKTLRWIEAHRPRVVCFVDYPGFNLRLAAALNRAGLAERAGGPVRLAYYIGPQIWAWKAKRRFAMAETLNALAVIFPFEPEYFADTGLDTRFVGHPFVSAGHEPLLRYDPQAPILLLPGSRVTPVRRIFPLELAAYCKLHERGVEVPARVVYPGPGVKGVLEEVLAAQAPAAVRARVELVSSAGGPHGGRAVLTSSGTMSLSCGLAGIPGALVYRAHPWTYWMAKWFLKVEKLGITNWLLDEPMYPEYIQKAARPSVLADVLHQAMTDPAIRKRAANEAALLRRKLAAPAGLAPEEWLEEQWELAGGVSE